MARTLTELQAARYKLQERMKATRKRGQELQTKYQADGQALNNELEELAKDDLKLEGAMEQEEERAADAGANTKGE